MSALRFRARGISGADRARGAAIVEFAVVLPLLLALLFGIIEYGWIFMLRQTMQNAAREGARQLVLQTSVPPYTNVYDRVNDVMQPTGVTGYSTDLATDGCEETVSLSIPYYSVSLLGGFFGTADYNLRASATMRKEGCTAE